MRILPAPDELTAPYWAAARRHRLVVQRCACGRLSHPPVARCPACHGRTLTWEEMSGEGVVHAFTWVAHSVHPVSAGQTPYILVLVELSEGPRILTNLRGCAPAEPGRRGPNCGSATVSLTSSKSTRTGRPTRTSAGTP